METEFSDFLNGLLADEPNPISSMEGACTVEVCRATVESAKTGKTVEIQYLKI